MASRLGGPTSPLTAATEQELRQAVPTRLTAALGGTGALPVSVGEGRLRVCFDGGVPLRRADAAHGTSVR
ncbi:hypothetical protein ACIQB5_46760 [Streptomyces sp. NPDC088560]|uniref:hypothetical protein n=1 Tax=Streptomyces sp. NPDC088560 TaxID=3365868 RepID=UPI003819A091